jgi:predicted Rossmann fold nucleotide-binding protein DprA/Smf involved in DNA uptake
MNGRIGVQRWRCERCHAVELYCKLPPDWRKTETGCVCVECIRSRRKAKLFGRTNTQGRNVPAREPADMKAAVLRLMRKRGPTPTKVIAKRLHVRLPAMQMLLSEMRMYGLVRLVPKKYYVLTREAI